MIPLDDGLLAAFLDHRVDASALVPGMAWALLALGGRSPEGTAFEALALRRPVAPADLERVRLVADPSDDVGTRLRFLDENGREVASLTGSPPVDDAPHVESVGVRASTPLDPYPAFDAAGNHYGSTFRGLRDVRVDVAGGQARLENAPCDRCAPASKTFLGRLQALDAAIQLVGATRGGDPHPFVLESVDRIRFVRDPISVVRLECAVTEGESKRTRVARVLGFDGDDRPVLLLDGVRIAALDPRSEPEGDAPPLGIAGTFTLEPLEPVLAFWAAQLDMPVAPRFAPYGQAFQALLDPDGPFGARQARANLSVLRIEDWALPPLDAPSAADVAKPGAWKADGPAVDDMEPGGAGSDLERRTLPNGLVVTEVNRYETDYLYEEIFAERAYLRHGISLEGARCVIDVGANIGMFTLFVGSEAPDAHVYAFEPGAAVFDALRANVARLGPRGHVFNRGVAAAAGEAVFTYYENSTVFSTFAADAADDARAIRAVVENMVVSRTGESANVDGFDDVVDGLVDQRLESRSMTVQLVALSDLIREQAIDRVDLLKVDAEKSELPILQGIDDEHWPLIRQVVIEVHDTEGGLIRDVIELLESKGFDCQMSEEALLETSGLYNLYAIRRVAGVDGSVDDGLLDASARRRIESAVDDWIRAARAFGERTTALHAVALAPMSERLAASPADRRFLASLERRIRTACTDARSTAVIDTERMVRRYAVDVVHDVVGDREGRVPYAGAWYAGLGTETMRMLHARSRPPTKVVVLDGDNTLWSGVCGEVGPEGVTLDAASLALQERMKRLLSHGVLLCLASKNTDADVVATFAAHPEFPLTIDDVVARRINWSPKPDNLLELSVELDLGLESFVFVDDNPVECAAMREQRPEVVTVLFDQEARTDPEHVLDHVWSFDTNEAARTMAPRTRLYREQALRERAREETPTLADFIRDLDLRIDVATATSDDATRVAELTMRTNQFNTTALRRDSDAILALIESSRSEILVVRVSDRFGDYGLVGVAIVAAIEPHPPVVEALLLSCRVLGRGVEHAVLAELARRAIAAGHEQLEIPYIVTARNAPARDFLTELASSVGSLSSQDGSSEGRLVFSTTALAGCRFDPSRPANSSPSDRPVTTGTGNLGRAHAAVATRIATEWNDAGRIQEAVDVAAAPRERPDLPTAWKAPANDAESHLIELFEQVLGMRGIGAEDSFFELGGRSLDAVRLVASAREAGIVRIGITDVFARPDARALAAPTATVPTSSATSPPAPRRRDVARRRRVGR